VAAVLVGLAWAVAAENQPAEPQAAPSPAPPSAEEIAALVKQLDADKFADRQAASEKLTAIGKPAIEALIGAATGESLEAAVRAIDILKKALDSSDAPTKDAAKAALEQIAQSEQSAAARRAQDALKAFEERQRAPAQAVPGAIQIAVVGGGARRVSVRNVNGVKTIEAEEDGKKVKIVDDPKQGIQMEVTGKKDGKETTDKYEAKNADELKKKHPDAYKIYSKYSGAGRAQAFGMQIQVGGNVRRVVQPQRVNTIDTAARILPAWARHLERMASDEAIKQASRESNAELKKKIGEVQEQLSKLEKRLQEAIDKADQEAEKKAPEKADEPAQPQENDSSS
jgi:hypothetical protein